MKRLLFFIFITSSINVCGQDTLIVFNNYKYKIGGKLLVDHSMDGSLSGESSFVTSGGLQVVRRFGNSKSSLESGAYLMSKASGSDFSRIIFRNLTIPINYRYDTRVFYIAGGPFVDYLVGRKNSNEELSTTYNDRKLNLGFNLTVGIEKSISKQLNLLVEAHHFNNLTSYRTTHRGYFSQSFVNNGFSIGLNYKLLQ